MKKSLFVLVLALLAVSRTATASSFQVGDLISYTQGSWGGDPLIDGGATLLVAQYDNVYAGSFGIVTVGTASGFTMRFTDASSVLAYEPAIGPFGPLNGSVLNPITTASGGFGGEVLGLELNVDFSDAGVLLGSTGVRLGDLMLANFGAGSPFNGLTVRQFLGDVNILLGGGSTAFTIGDLGSLVGDVNASFSAGNPSPFAQAHLVEPASQPSAVPEPATLLLVAAPALSLAVRRKKATR
jgi:hypothetical protein